MPLILGANSVSGYTVKNSLRFNSGSQDYLNRTQGTSTNQNIATFSIWFKRSILGTTQRIFEGYTASTDAGNSAIEINTSDQVQIDGYTTSWRIPTQVFRDISAWYHLVVAYDTTQATASNRVKVYVNGAEITTFSTNNNPTQNSTFGFNNNSSVLQIGRRRITASNDNFYNGYFSETYFIDGQALTPSSFGETDTASGIWIPKAYTGSYGTNGFFLKFLNSASLGTDSSGNGNTWTVNNLTSIDQTTDTPTNNFATANSLIPSTLTYTDGNCTFQRTTSDWESTGSTIALTKGKWYAEFKWISGTFTIIGVEDMALVSTWDNEYMGFSINGRGYGWDGDSRNNGSTSAFGNTFTTGDIIGVALDMDNKFVYMSKNGVFQNSGVPTSGATGTGGLSLSGTEYIIGAGAYNSTISANYGNPPFTIASGNTDGAGFGNFEYAVPSGYYALCTKNLANFG
jgi:hypothetical protein